LTYEIEIWFAEFYGSEKYKQKVSALQNCSSGYAFIKYLMSPLYYLYG